MDMSCSEPAKDRLHELSAVLAQNHFEVSPSEDGALSVIFGGERLCRVVDGRVRYYPDDLKTHEKEDACDRVADIAQTVSEYMRNMEIAPTLKASGLNEDFKLLAEFNDCILAGRFSGEGRGAQFVIWEWGYERKGLYYGHYFENDYEGAKEDFARRAGLVDKHRLVTCEQYPEIYRMADEALNSDFGLSGKAVEALRSICNQIECVLPDVQERISTAAQTPEQTQSQQFNM